MLLVNIAFFCKCFRSAIKVEILKIFTSFKLKSCYYDLLWIFFETENFSQGWQFWHLKDYDVIKYFFVVVFQTMYFTSHLINAIIKNVFFVIWKENNNQYFFIITQLLIFITIQVTKCSWSFSKVLASSVSVWVSRFTFWDITTSELLIQNNSLRSIICRFKNSFYNEFQN